MNFKQFLSISPCPNDTFMFDALVNGRIDTEGLDFELLFADIEELNKGAVEGRAAISKVSCAVLPLIAERYAVLDCGNALGRGNGPLLVSKRGVDLTDPLLRIAVPGEHTTANLLMERIFPHLQNKTPLLFSDIAPAVAAGRYDAGVLIHEGRFTYAERGLRLEADLGAEWDRLTGLPLPLGAVVISRDVPLDVRQKIERLLRRSIEYAFANPGAGAEFVRSHAQELSPQVLEQHIYMFVNGYSLTLGDEGRRAVMALTGLDDKIFA